MLKKSAALLKKIFTSRMVKIGAITMALIAISIAASNRWIASSADGRLYDSTAEIPFNDVGLVLGANKNARGGPNLYFENRIDAAAALFKAGKIRHLLVSGDNHISEYDEATDMKNALVARGVPDTCITLDYAGFRTLDSVVRCKKVFGQKKVTIISQEFHNQRAVFIAGFYDMEAIGFNAKDVPASYSLKTNFREYIARFKAVLDLYLLRTSPRFLGEEVKIRL